MKGWILLTVILAASVSSEPFALTDSPEFLDELPTYESKGKQISVQAQEPWSPRDNQQFETLVMYNGDAIGVMDATTQATSTIQPQDSGTSSRTQPTHGE